VNDRGAIVSVLSKACGGDPAGLLSMMRTDPATFDTLWYMTVPEEAW
jgi:hypothetical protein